MRTLVIPPAKGTLEEAITRSAGVLPLVRRERAIIVTACAIEDEKAIVLGRLQRAGRVLDWPAVIAEKPRILRRPTTGTGFAIDGGALITLALPSIDAIFSDATPRTVLNRNVRPLLRGFEAAGVPVSYFGREWLACRPVPGTTATTAVRGRAIAVLGLEVDPDGVCLVEAYVTQRGSLALPRSLVTPLEASCDRYRGREPLSLDELRVPQLDLDRVVLETADRTGHITFTLRTEVPADESRKVMLVDGPASPLSDDATFLEPRTVPIGFLDVAVTDREAWVGGDLLGPTFALGHYAAWSDQEPRGAGHVERSETGRGGSREARFAGGERETEQLPMEGALWDDVRRAYDLAQRHLALRSP
ncbi:MAG: hypothetical protein HOW73_13565 [Polyangiaceae bacterium]|nr:hypothetical protein [Polyangiaceae bacterium]